MNSRKHDAAVRRKSMDQKCSREEISGATDKVNALTLLLDQMAVPLLLPR